MNNRIYFFALLVLMVISGNGYGSSMDDLADMATGACKIQRTGAYFEERKLFLSSGAVRVSGERWIGMAATNWYFLRDGSRLKTFRFKPGGARHALILEVYDRSSVQDKGIANRGIYLDDNCMVVDHLLVEFDIGGRPLRFAPTGSAIMQNDRLPILNPKVGPGRQRTGPIVAVIDSGVNYLLPQIKSSLARDESGNLIGYDFIDDDSQPFDEDYILGSLWFSLRHGTSVASVLLGHYSGVLIAPYRHPATDPSKYKAVFDHMAANKIRIANISIGGGNKRDWAAFYDAALLHPEILLIMSAGNEGVDLDSEARFPGSFKLENSIVVMGLDRQNNKLKDSNFGASSVDVGVIAEGIQGFSFDGREVALLGTSYAAPLVSAFAARVLAQEPNISASELKRRILKAAVKSENGMHFSKYGQITFR